MTKGDPPNHTDTPGHIPLQAGLLQRKQGEEAAVSVIGFIILLMRTALYMILHSAERR